MQLAVLFFGIFVQLFVVLNSFLKDNKDEIIGQYLTEEGYEFILELTRGFAGKTTPNSF